MADNWRKRTVYPPRYFAGHITLKRKGKPLKVEFFNAPILPVSAFEARIYCGLPGSPFYEEGAQEFADLHNLEAMEIQYAISIYDAKQGGYTVEKFNHPFIPGNTRLHFQGDHLAIRTKDGSPVYGTFKVNKILDDVSDCDVPVTQFIS